LRIRTRGAGVNHNDSGW